MTYLSHLECGEGGTRLSPQAPLSAVCADRGILFARYDLQRLRREVPRARVEQGPASLWRYAALLPAENPRKAVTLGEGFTPLLPCDRIGASLGVRELLVKDEGQNPTGSFKDRGSAVALTRYRELGVRTVALNSSGNAGGSWSLYAARAGIRCVSLLPTDNQPASRKQCIAMPNSTYVMEDWHTAGRAVAEACQRNGWFNVNTLLEPYRVEGKKTMGLEIAEQLGWRLPAAIFYPMGGGTGAIAIWKAFDELLELGWVTGKLPRIFITQYEGCAPMVKAFEEGRSDCEAWGHIDILPGGLKSPKPMGDRHVLSLLRKTGGAAIAVSSEDALACTTTLAREEGIYACPEGATTLAGLRKARERGLIGADEQVVLVNTGSGLKSIPSMPEVATPRVLSGADIG